MQDFKSLQKDIQAKRTALQALESQLYLDKQNLIRLGQSIRATERERTGGRLPSGNLLMRQQKSSANKLEEATSKKAKTFKELSELEKAFLAQGSPQELIKNLDDGIPFLLLPIKMQTRFIQVKHISQGLDPSVISDVSELESMEDNSHFHIGDQIKAGGFQIPVLSTLKGDEATKLKKALDLRNLSTKGGFFLPKVEDEYELWVRFYPDDIFMHTHEENLTEQEQTNGQNYWNSIWGTVSQEENERERLQTEAWEILQSSYGAPRALWIAHQTKPENYFGPGQELSDPPEFPQLELKADSWTVPPKTYTLPDQFVVHLYREGVQKVRVITANPLRYPLILGFDPFEEREENFTPTEDGKLKMPEEIKWITDFEEAEKVGMAIRIPLNKTEWQNGFSKMIVLGVKASADQVESQKLLENLFINHQHKAGGMSILPPGTPTNNTKKRKSPYNKDKEHLSLPATAPLLQPLFDLGDDSDGEQILHALGLSPNTFQFIPGTGASHIQEAKRMNEALWPATWGYYLENFLFPIITHEEMEMVRSFFTEHVLARSALPVLRVDKQPYGILATSAYKKWTYRPKDSHKDFLKRMYSNVLHPLNIHWESLAGKVKHLGDLDDQNFVEEFMNLIGLNPTSGRFFHRYLVGDYLTKGFLQLATVRVRMRDLNELNILDKEVLYQQLQDLGLSFAYTPIRSSNRKVTSEPSPRLLEHFYMQETRQIEAPLVDHLPPSEKRGLSPLGGLDQNYLDWLFQTPIQDILKQSPPLPQDRAGNDQPMPILYMFARQALLQEYLNAAIKILRAEERVSKVSHLDLETNNLAPPLTNAGSARAKLLKEHQDMLRAYLYHEQISIIRQEVIKRANEIFTDIVNNEEYDAFVERELKKRIREENLDRKVILDINQFARSANDRLRQNKWEYLNFEVDGQKVLSLLEGEADLPDSAPESAKNGIEQLDRVKKALQILKDLPTARLERLFMEHVDLSAYRLDAWMQGLVNDRLADQRKETPDGIYLGAYGYLEQISRNKAIERQSIREIPFNELQQIFIDDTFDDSISQKCTIPFLNFKYLEKTGASLDQLMAKSFVYLGSEQNTQFIQSSDPDQVKPSVPVPEDPSSEGFLSTPSLPHATTSAILRSGYKAQQAMLANNSNAHDVFSINLNSERVRKALSILEGMKNGQELGALLGYQFERKLHDAQLDRHVNEIRLLFPLRPKNPNEQNANGDAESVQNFHLTDGLSLVNAFRESPDSWHQNTITSDLPAIEGILGKLDDMLDALSDLLTAESVFQMVNGNLEKSKAALNVLHDGGQMDTPEVVKTPQKGRALSHLVGIVFDTSEESISWTPMQSARSHCSPRLNQWLTKQLPAPSRIGVSIQNAEEQWTIFCADEWDIQPIDLVYMLHQQIPGSSFGVLPHFLKQKVSEKLQIPPSEEVNIDLKKRDGFDKNQITLFELKPLIAQLFRLLQNSRPLIPEAFFPPSERRVYTSDEYRRKLSFQDTSYKALRTMAKSQSADMPFLLRNMQARIRSSGFELRRDKNQEKYTAAYQALFKATQFGIEEAVPKVGGSFSLENLISLNEQLIQVDQILEKRLKQALNFIDQADDSLLTPEEYSETLQELGQILFGESFKLCPLFNLFNPNEVQAAHQHPNLLKDADDFAVEEWLQGVSLVQAEVKTFQQTSLLREALQTPDADTPLQILQLPYHPDGSDRWLGVPFPESFQPDTDTLSLAMELPGNFDPTKKQAGLIIDEWTEIIPDKLIDAGLAIHYDQPNMEPPQLMLLAVSPDQSGQWSWEDLLDTISETFDMAKKRAVDPNIIMRNSPLDHFLPAILSPVDSAGHTATTDYGNFMSKPINL